MIRLKPMMLRAKGQRPIPFNLPACALSRLNSSAQVSIRKLRAMKPNAVVTKARKHPQKRTLSCVVVCGTAMEGGGACATVVIPADSPVGRMDLNEANSPIWQGYATARLVSTVQWPDSAKSRVVRKGDRTREFEGSCPLFG